MSKQTLARHLRVGEWFRYLGGLFYVLAKNNKGTVSAVMKTGIPFKASADCPRYYVLSRDRLVEPQPLTFVS